MNIKKILMASALGTTLILGACGTQNSNPNNVFNAENNSGITINHITLTDLAEKLNSENHFSGVIFLGQEGSPASDAIAYELLSNEQSTVDAIYFADSSSNEGHEELVEAFISIGATFYWDDDHNPILPAVELLVIQDGFTLVRLSDFTILNEELGNVDATQIGVGINDLFNLVEMINDLHNSPSSNDELEEFDEAIDDDGEVAEGEEIESDEAETTGEATENHDENEDTDEN